LQRLRVDFGEVPNGLLRSGAVLGQQTPQSRRCHSVVRQLSSGGAGHSSSSRLPHGPLGPPARRAGRLLVDQIDHRQAQACPGELCEQVSAAAGHLADFRDRRILAMRVPSVTDWIGSLGTAAGFLIASVSFAYDRYRRRRTDRLAQARLVDGWLGKTKLDEVDVQGAKRAALSFTVFISNASQEVARHVRLEVTCRDEQPLFPGFTVTDIGMVPPTRSDQPFSYSQTFRAGVELDIDFDCQMASWRGYDLILRFTDTAGQRWVRKADGALNPTVNLAAEKAADDSKWERMGVPKELR